MAPLAKPCGTYAAYRRHLRHGEPPCPACAKAGRDERQRYRKADKAKRKARAAKAVEARTAALKCGLVYPLPDDFLAAGLRENLASVKAALEQATPSSVARLSARRQELEAALWETERPQPAKRDVFDELAARRKARLAKAAGQ